MSRALVEPAAPARHVEPSPAPYWTQMTNVRVSGSRTVIDLVLVGPSGVHVVIDRPGHPNASSAVSEPDDDLERTAERAVAAAAGVAELLPLRYRNVVTPQVSLAGLTETAVEVGVAFAASPDVLRHVWRQGPRVVSTSEAAAIVRRLRDRLEPIPVEPTPRSRGWWRRRARRSLIAGAAAVTGLAAAVVAAVTVGIPL